MLGRKGSVFCFPWEDSVAYAIVGTRSIYRAEGKLTISVNIEPPLEREANVHSSPMTGQKSYQKASGKIAGRREN